MSTDCQDLKGKCALITGSSRGIGRGIALRLAERGAAVAVNYLQDSKAAADTVARIQGQGGQAFQVQADVSRPEELTIMMSEVKARFGALDIFVSNALGDLLSFLSPPLKVTPEQWDTAYSCQSRAFLLAVQQVTPLLRNAGRILAISYWPGSHLGGFLPYFAMGANKAALESMCRYFAVALAPRGITVNAVCAGLTEDSIVNKLPPEAQEAIRSWLRSGWTPMGRQGTPADIGGAVAALCSADAGWITGQTIVADGGAALMSPEMPIIFQQP
jgi:NAD(P)-dependent dehydrogenase (short-subunit alcohol dehydrogenase family)